jgi:hypothetical protein
MEPNIPIPTDNIYKFACLFGLTVFISSMLGSIYVTTRFNELSSKNILELAELRAKENLSTVESTQMAILERHIEVNRSDRKIFEVLLVACIAGNFWLSVWAFREWFKKV